MSDKKLIAVIGDYGFTSYPLMTAVLERVLVEQGLDADRKKVAVVNSHCRGAENHSVAFNRDFLSTEPVIVPMPWNDMSEPCLPGKRAADGKEYNKLAGVKRDNQILGLPNLVAVVYIHLVTDGKQLNLESRFPRLVTAASVPTYVIQVEARKKNGKRVGTTLLEDQAIPAPIIPTTDLIRSVAADKPWATRARDLAYTDD